MCHPLGIDAAGKKEFAADFAAWQSHNQIRLTAKDAKAAKENQHLNHKGTRRKTQRTQRKINEEYFRSCAQNHSLFSTAYKKHFLKCSAFAARWPAPQGTGRVFSIPST